MLRTRTSDQATRPGHFAWLLTEDPDVRLLLYSTAGHPDCVALVAHLEVHWPARFVLAYHKTNCLCRTDQNGAGQPGEDWLWQHCDLRYFARAGPPG